MMKSPGNLSSSPSVVSFFPPFLCALLSKTSDGNMNCFKPKMTFTQSHFSPNVVNQPKHIWCLQFSIQEDQEERFSTAEITCLNKLNWNDSELGVLWGASQQKKSLEHGLSIKVIPASCMLTLLSFPIFVYFPKKKKTISDTKTFQIQTLRWWISASRNLSWVMNYIWNIGILCRLYFIIIYFFPLIKCSVYIASRKIQCVDILVKLNVDMACIP